MSRLYGLVVLLRKLITNLKHVRFEEIENNDFDFTKLDKLKPTRLTTFDNIELLYIGTTTRQLSERFKDYVDSKNRKNAFWKKFNSFSWNKQKKYIYIIKLEENINKNDLLAREMELTLECKDQFGFKNVFGGPWCNNDSIKPKYIKFQDYLHKNYFRNKNKDYIEEIMRFLRHPGSLNININGISKKNIRLFLASISCHLSNQSYTYTGTVSEQIKENNNSQDYVTINIITDYQKQFRDVQEQLRVTQEENQYLKSIKYDNHEYQELLDETVTKLNKTINKFKEIISQLTEQLEEEKQISNYLKNKIEKIENNKLEREKIENNKLEREKIETQYKLERENIKTQYKLEREKIETQYNLERENIKTQYKLERENIETQYNLERENIETQYKLERENIETQYKLEKEKLQKKCDKIIQLQKKIKN